MRHGFLQDLGFGLCFWAMASLVVAPVSAQAGQLPDEPPVVVQPDPDSYWTTNHARLVYWLWGITAPAALVLEGDVVEIQTSGDSLEDLQGSGDQEPVTVAVGSFVIADELLLGDEVHEFETETTPSYTVVVNTAVTLVAGTLTTDRGLSAYVVGATDSYEGSYVGTDVEGDYTRLIVLEELGTLEEATDFVAGARDAQKNPPSPGDEPWWTCHSTWVGNDGFQCCVLELSYSSKSRSCFDKLMRDLLLCLLVGGGAAGTVFFQCLKYIPIPSPVNFKLCFGIAGVTGVAAALVCASAYYYGYLSCQQDALAWYFEALANSGCANPPGGGVG